MEGGGGRGGAQHAEGGGQRQMPGAACGHAAASRRALASMRINRGSRLGRSSCGRAGQGMDVRQA